MKILIATNNPRKVDWYKFLFDDYHVEFLTPTELNIEPKEVEEGNDIQVNARNKALAYRGKTNLPILGNDSAFTIHGEKHEPAQVKRAALNGKPEHEMSQQEIAAAMTEYYQGIVKKNGGSVRATWTDCYVLIFPDGSEKSICAERHVTMGKVKEPIEPYWPLRSMYTVDATGKYPADQSEEEVKIELAPITNALVELLELPKK